MLILILSFFYIFSILLTWIVIFFQEKNKIITFGDLLDKMPTVMYIPVFNGLLIICYLIALLIINIEEKILKKLQGRNKNIWTKIRNIKLKKNIMNNKIENILLHNTIEFPSIDDLTNMPSDSMFEYINSTYCNGIVNMIENKSAFMIARYTIEENMDCHSFELNDDDYCLSQYFKNIDEINNISNGDWFHTDYRKFCGDDVIITGESESYYYFIWFDNDVSDCSVAKLKKEHFNSISDFEMETVKYFNHIGYKINPIRKPNGWIKW